MEIKRPALHIGAGIDRNEGRSRGPQQGLGFSHTACRKDDLEGGIGGPKGENSFRVEPVRVGIAAEDKIDTAEMEGVDDSFGDAEEFIRSALRLTAQRVGEVGIDEDSMTGPLDEKSALPQPPDMDRTGDLVRFAEVGEEIFVFLDGHYHEQAVGR